MSDVSEVHSAAARASSATKIYGKGDTLVTALDNVDISFEAGKFSAIMGPSGSGKSTLMHCMAGLDNLSSGKVFIGDTDLTVLSEKELTLLRRSNIGFIFQSFNLVPTLNALENITLPIDLSGNKVDTDWVGQITEVVNLSDRLKHKPNELSGGQQQRVAVSRALASKPNIIFADEPTGNLDSKTGNEILDFMKLATTDLNQTIVMVTHDPVAASYSDRVIFLEDGRVVGEIIEPTADSVIDQMRTFGS
ncbi:MAG: ABC transporter ATP-binding protein [Acidimicrobiales bacterium]